MQIDYGSTNLAQIIEGVIGYAHNGMGKAILTLIPIIYSLLLISLFWDILISVVKQEFNTIIKDLMLNVLWGLGVILLLKNWIDGIGLLPNYIEPMMLETIPKFVFDFEIGGQKLYVENGYLLNFDSLWHSLKEIPDNFYKFPNVVSLLIEWIFGLKLGYTFMMIIFKLILYVVIIFMFIEIVGIILKVHIVLAFSGISIFVLSMRQLRDAYGMSLLGVLLSSSIQYYLIFMMVGILTGYIKYLANFNSLIYIVGTLMCYTMFKALNQAISSLGSKL